MSVLAINLQQSPRILHKSPKKSKETLSASSPISDSVLHFTSTTQNGLFPNAQLTVVALSDFQKHNSQKWLMPREHTILTNASDWSSEDITTWFLFFWTPSLVTPSDRSYNPGKVPDSTYSLLSFSSPNYMLHYSMVYLLSFFCQPFPYAWVSVG